MIKFPINYAIRSLRPGIVFAAAWQMILGRERPPGFETGCTRVYGLMDNEYFQEEWTYVWSNCPASDDTGGCATGGKFVVEPNQSRSHRGSRLGSRWSGRGGCRGHRYLRGYEYDRTRADECHRVLQGWRPSAGQVYRADQSTRLLYSRPAKH